MRDSNYQLYLSRPTVDLVEKFPCLSHHSLLTIILYHIYGQKSSGNFQQSFTRKMARSVQNAQSGATRRRSRRRKEKGDLIVALNIMLCIVFCRLCNIDTVCAQLCIADKLLKFMLCAPLCRLVIFLLCDLLPLQYLCIKSIVIKTIDFIFPLKESIKHLCKQPTPHKCDRD